MLVLELTSRRCNGTAPRGIWGVEGSAVVGVQDLPVLGAHLMRDKHEVQRRQRLRRGEQQQQG